MEIPVEISLPELWGEETYERREWGHFNYLIGPNGTGKSLFTEQLENQVSRSEYSMRTLNSERLTGMERRNYGNFARTQIQQGFNIEQEDRYLDQARNFGLSSDAYVELRDKPDLRARIQATLSEFFNREIELNVEGRFLQPQIRDKESSSTYDVRENESHGLKELISLLTLIHDDSNDIMAIDEPELHLHPQYQRYLLQEIRKLAGHPDEDNSKAFFLITHSPTMIEFRNIEDLTNVYSFRSRAQPPFSVNNFESEDEYRIRRLLPRLNTRHKEVLFSRKPILVEGYTDEEIYSLAIEKHEELTADPESTIIGVGGKDDVDAFLRFCRNLGLQPRVISDLDILFRGNLRETISDFEQIRSLAQEAGLDSDISSAIGEAQRRLHSFGQTIDAQPIHEDQPNIVHEVSQILDDLENPSKRQYVILRAIESVRQTPWNR